MIKDLQARDKRLDAANLLVQVYEWSANALEIQRHPLRSREGGCQIYKRARTNQRGHRVTWNGERM
jgi:hypothetical protein